jgi:hypothetical protein
MKTKEALLTAFGTQRDFIIPKHILGTQETPEEVIFEGE